MAGFQFEIPDSFQKELTKLADIDKMAPVMLKEAGKVYESHLKKELEKHKRTGDLIKSIKMNAPKKTKSGAWITIVSFQGKDQYGIRNGLKAAELEYGNSNQKATPFVTAVNKNSEKEVVDVMTKVMKGELDA